MPKLRGHHLICLHFYRGEGYTGEFVENLNAILKKLTQLTQEPVEIVSVADSVCLACPYLKLGKCHYSGKNSEEEIRKLDALALSLLNFMPGDKALWHDIRNKIPEIFAEWRDFACKNCSWKSACSKNALWRELNEKASKSI